MPDRYRSVKIPTGSPMGLISLYAYPVRRPHVERQPYSRSFKAFCYDDGVEANDLFIKTPKELRGFFREQITTYYNTRNIRSPCVIVKCTSHEEPSYVAKLLVPPGISKDSPAFLSDLIVPALRIHEPVEVESSLVGYLMTSDHLGAQKLFVHLSRMPKSLSGLSPDELSDARFQGKIMDPHKGDGKNPYIHIISNSLDSPFIFDQNAEKLEELEGGLEGSAKFWWELYPAD